MSTRYVVGNPEYKQITKMLKAVDRLHRIAAHLPMQNTNEVNLEDTGRPSISSTPASHKHGQRAAPHQVVTKLDPSSTPTCISFPKDPSTYSSCISWRRDPFTHYSCIFSPRDPFTHPHIHFLTLLIFHLLHHPLFSTLISIRPLLLCTLSPPHTSLVI